jgi:hypothetical protein
MQFWVKEGKSGSKLVSWVPCSVACIRGLVTIIGMGHEGDAFLGQGGKERQQWFGVPGLVECLVTGYRFFWQQQQQHMAASRSLPLA